MAYSFCLCKIESFRGNGLTKRAVYRENVLLKWNLTVVYVKKGKSLVCKGKVKSQQRKHDFIGMTHAKGLNSQK